MREEVISIASSSARRKPSTAFVFRRCTVRNTQIAGGPPLLAGRRGGPFWGGVSGVASAWRNSKRRAGARSAPKRPRTSGRPSPHCSPPATAGSGRRRARRGGERLQKMAPKRNANKNGAPGREKRYLEAGSGPRPPTGRRGTPSIFVFPGGVHGVFTGFHRPSFRPRGRVFGAQCGSRAGVIRELRDPRGKRYPRRWFRAAAPYRP